MTTLAKPALQETIPFNAPYVTGNEFVYMPQAINNKQTAGDGPFSKKCKQWLEETLGVPSALMVNSCTSALEIASLLLELDPGDEVIMTPYTFVTTANAVVKAGGVPVFVDIRPDTLNIDETKIEAAITPRTKAIMVVHYAAIACDMTAIMAIAKKHHLIVIEDAAHCINASYFGQELGTIGHLATYSFHETKNLTCGEGGALIVNNKRFLARAEIIRHSGTNRAQFFRGQVNKYSWVDIGSAYMMSDLNAAYLWAQMEQMPQIMDRRRQIWKRYQDAFLGGEMQEIFRRPVVPQGCEHNGHLYYLLLPSSEKRDDVLSKLREQDIHAVFHYVPLHSSEGGKKFARSHGDLAVTNDLPYRLIRLPFFYSMTNRQQDRVIEAVYQAAR